MFLRRVLDSQAGISMVQVMIAAAMMGGLALVMGKLGKNQSKMARGARESTDINTLHANLEKILLNSNSCKATISQIPTLPDDSSTTITEIRSRIDDHPSTPTVVKYKTGRDNNIGTIYIEAIQVTRTNINDIRLNFIIKKLSEGKRASYGGKTINKTIDLFGKFVGNTPVGCYSQMDNAVSTAVKEACESTGPNAEIVNGQCMNGRMCDIEKIALAASITGGTTTACNPAETVTGIGLWQNLHTIHGCRDFGGTVINYQNKKLCQFSGGSCPSGWNTAYTKTSAKSGSGDRKCGCSRPRCTTGFHSTWGTGRETCTHARVRDKGGSLCLASCRNSGSVTEYANITAVACY